MSQTDPNPLRLAVTLARQLGRAIGGKDARTRYNARYGLVRRLAIHWGFEIYNANLVWHEDEDFLAAWRQFQGHELQRADRKIVVWSLARTVRELAGDTAECGVFEGASSHLICLATGPADGRLHHVFDSFEGLSAPQQADRPRHDHSYHWAKHDLSVPLEKVKSNLGRFPWVRYHQGWIPERFGEVADRRFNFVHVDVDLHQPTKDSLHFFYERMIPGGILLCDDYGSATCPGAKTAFDDLVRDQPERSVVHLPTGQGFIVKR